MMVSDLNEPVVSKPKAKDDYWGGGFGDDFDDIPDAAISE